MARLNKICVVQGLVYLAGLMGVADKPAVRREAVRLARDMAHTTRRLRKGLKLAVLEMRDGNLSLARQVVVGLAKAEQERVA